MIRGNRIDVLPRAAPPKAVKYCLQDMKNEPRRLKNADRWGLRRPGAERESVVCRDTTDIRDQCVRHRAGRGTLEIHTVRDTPTSKVLRVVYC